MAKSDDIKKKAGKKAGKKAVKEVGDKPDEKIPAIPQNEEIKREIKGRKLFRSSVKKVTAVQRMVEKPGCSNPECINLPRGKLPGTKRFYRLRRYDCICVYNHDKAYQWKHGEEAQNGDPTDYKNNLLSKIHNNTTCCICMNDLGENNLSKCSNDGCNYFCHNHCILEWSDKNTTCPYCRSSIF